MGGRRRACLVCAVVLLASTTAAMGRADSLRTKTAREASPTSGRATIKVVVELFQVVLVDEEAILYRRDERALDVRGPDAALAALMPDQGSATVLFLGKPAIVHSTSWRYEPDGTVLLTYLAFSEKSKNQAQLSGARRLPVRELPGIGTTDPDKPRPADLKHIDVLAHGLRHLALLARRSGSSAFAARLGPTSRKFFAAIEPEVAGEVRSPVPSTKEAR